MSRIFYCSFGQVSKSTVNNFRTVRTFRSGAPSWDNLQRRHVLYLFEFEIEIRGDDEPTKNMNINKNMNIYSSVLLSSENETLQLLYRVVYLAFLELPHNCKNHAFSSIPSRRLAFQKYHLLFSELRIRVSNKQSDPTNIGVGI